MSTLHPNLARVAAIYDDIVNDLNTGKIESSQAYRLIGSLSAKDDNGVEWSINPENGVWRYRSIDGEMREAEPPQVGMASLTPYDIGKKRRNKFDEKLTYHEVSRSLPEPNRQRNGYFIKIGLIALVSTGLLLLIF
ncbi:MAG: hypothetical protein ACKOW9_03430 [Candidatus Paceibacterota bacterium]